MTPLTKIGLVFINLLFWAGVLFIGYYYDWRSPPFSTADGTYYPSMLWGNFFNGLVVYVNALLLYPYSKKLWLPYWLSVILLITGTALLEAYIDYSLVFELDLVEKLDAIIAEQGLEDLPRWSIISGWFIEYTFIHLAWYILSFSLIFFYESYRNQQIQQALEKEKLKAELKFLKAQINPHFLFNGINSVFFLIDDKPDIAKSTLLKFSDLLRYQLYECQDDFIPLKKELDHIKSYVEMEKIRKGEDVKIQLSLPSAIGSQNISPLLFTPFLENAFKYVSNDDDGTKNQIAISFRLQERQLHFEVENTVDAANSISKGGIGITNVKKRLSLLYSNKHHLDIFEKDQRYIVRLNLVLGNDH